MPKDIKHHSKLPFSRAFIWIFISTLAISGTSLLGTFYFFHIQALKQNDPSFIITELHQKCHNAEGIPNEFLFCLLGLNNKQNLHTYSLKEARKKLIHSAMITDLKLKKKFPNALEIDYSIRLPVAKLSHLTGALVDAEGYLIPEKMYVNHSKDSKPLVLDFLHSSLNNPNVLPLTLSLASYPEIVLNLTPELLQVKWGESIHNKELDLALKVLDKIQEHSWNVTRVDVSLAFTSKLGSREILIDIDEGGDKSVLITLRLNPDHYDLGIKNYDILHSYLLRKYLFFKMDQTPSKKKNIVDLRLKQLAFY